jgi:branched-chain amino acid transport system ATP-binding protein
VPEALLELKGLQARYGEMVALWGVDLHIGKGELVAVVGPNGAGKSTLINAISGLVDVHGGEARFEGQPIPPSAEARVRAGIVQSPEGRKLFPEMTVEENLLMGAYTRRDRGAVAASVEEVFSLFPILKERRRQIASTMSGGQQQMVAIGRALMAKPKLLMLDEPSLGLAPIVVNEVFDLLRRIHAGGMTILLVEQNVHQTLEIADRAYVLENGRIALEGSGREVLENPHMKAAYLGH